MISQLHSERKALAEGKKPKKNKDFQWVEDSLDFPMKYGKSKILRDK